MFSVGQIVYHRTRKHSGKVLECVGNTVYFVQANGVEMDFPMADLTATPPAQKTPAETLSATLSRAVTKMTGMSSPASRIWRSAAMPSVAGIMMSSTTIDGRSNSSRGRKVLPSWSIDT